MADWDKVFSGEYKKKPKPTEKEKRIQSQLKVGGSFIDPVTGLSTADSLRAGGGLLPERFREVDPSRLIRTDKKARAGELYLKSKGDPSNLSDEEKAFLYKYDSTFFIKYKPKGKPKLTQKQKDAEKAEAIRLKNEADPIGHISDIQKKIDDAKTLRRKTKEGSPERAQYDNIINTLTSKQDSIRNTNPKFNLKSLVKNLNKAVKVSSTTKVVPKTKTAKVEPKVYKSMEDARRLIKGQEKKDVRALATKIQREEGISRDEAWTKALTISNIQFNK